MLESLHPDPTFHPSPRLAMEAEAERLAYTVLLSPDRSRPDALAVVDVNPASQTFGSVLYRLVIALALRFLQPPGTRRRR